MSNRITGVQRYALELLAQFDDRVEKIAPGVHLEGIKGHIWEQFFLPKQLKGRLLWSPSNTGPLSVGKQVVSIMDVAPMDHPEWMNRRFSAWYGFLTPHLVRRVRSVLTISEFSKQRILHYCPDAEEKVTVTYLAADARFVPTDQEEVVRVQERLALPSPHYLVALGSLEPRKNLARLLRAWKNVEHKIPDGVWLVLAGAQGKKLVFGEQSFENLPPRVHLTGHVPDPMLPALYSGAIGAVYLSLYEGFGLPPLEAMACGAPVLTSNVTSLPEVVGNAGIAIDPYDVDAIGDGILRLVEDAGLRADLRANGLARAKLFSWDKTAKQTWEVLQEATQT